ncbi:MAG: prolipoprotein diacylglyceryl transferase [Elusimicrobiota bacterium]|jgi:phosphatidylglycerol:prolipoprotein diacylglycerol transferase|nr:prolipoprotein diacylglyceryl transferase [Elusimicrobiota bacterium]
MLPFIYIFGVKIPMYGVMTALGYGASVWYCLKRKNALGLTREQILDIIFYIILGALIGGKIFFIAFYPQDFFALSLFDKIRYGFVFLGGFIGAFAVGVYILRKQKVPVLPGADFFVQAVPLGHAIGKIGCFLAGCCYGKVAHSHLAVTFTNPQSLVPEHLHGVGLYPIQLVEAAASLLLFYLLYRISKRKHKDGDIVAGYMLGFGIIRFIAEFFRGEEEIYIAGITQNQITALIIAIAAATFLWRKHCYAKGK